MAPKNTPLDELLKDAINPNNPIWANDSPVVEAPGEKRDSPRMGWGNSLKAFSKDTVVSKTKPKS